MRLIRAVGVLLAVVAAGCGAGATGASAPATGHPSVSAVPTVRTRVDPLGTVLVDARGDTLYLLTADRPGHRSCAGPCLYVWPPVLVHGTATAGAGVTARLGLLAVPGGRQLTVNGYPAYTYRADGSPGQTNGQGVATYGGIWWALSPAGSPLTGTQGSPTPAAGYGGY